jgi:hypothetical protein
MIQYSLLGRTAASIRSNTTFRGLAPSPSSGKTDFSVLPEDGDGASPRNVVFKRIDAAVRPRRLYYIILHNVNNTYPLVYGCRIGSILK